jgi:hypothetical protein
MANYVGGFGLAPLGHTEFGNSKSDIEPRFSESKPIDKSINVATNEWLSFTTYCYSSWIVLENITVEISEDNGISYAVAFDGTSFLSPYDHVNSKVRRPDSHSILFIIVKAGFWPSAEVVKVRFTGLDEYGNTSTKEVPVFWG